MDCPVPEHPFVGFRRRIAPFETVIVGSICLSILDHAVLCCVFIWKTPLRDGAAAGMPPSRKNGLGLGWARARGAVVNLYIYIFSVQMNAIERDWTARKRPYFRLLFFAPFNWTRFWTLMDVEQKWTVQFDFLSKIRLFLGKKQGEFCLQKVHFRTYKCSIQMKRN